MKKPTIRYVGDKRIRDLLETHNCPTPFHVVRTRFLGNVATPRFDASPVEALKGLWGGELPELEGMDAANDLFQDMMGLWNHLARHQSRSKPFHLVRAPAEPTREGLHRLCLTRAEEIDGFVDGLYGTDEEIDLPESAIEGMEALAEFSASAHAALDLIADPNKDAPEHTLTDTLRLINRLTQFAGKDMHAVVLACVRARRQSLERAGALRPTIH